LAGRTLAESRLGSALDLTVLGLARNGQLTLAPRASNVLLAGDTLIVHGTPDHLQSFRGHEHLRIELPEVMEGLSCPNLAVAEGVVGAGSSLVGATLLTSGLRRRHRVHVLAVRNKDGDAVVDLHHHRLAAGDRLVMRAEPEALDALVETGLVEGLQPLPAGVTEAVESGHDRLLAVRVPPGSVLGCATWWTAGWATPSG
jgi:K+/H+ antiporter YhaU regulatory subunit KhtT